ncbi:SDR family NAD(P)-dependent oxidoreductase [Salisediminibacterium selenitireducens]|uniref:Short-chain dehydrogenase/reductase SDR n=1 Tax=Bacillus selenitireducens (strain ATCC 700615 / DSM 15326 / MLS10) TaxID=439292 RepID=D6Y085_BACIE|nr:SDR family oxidoreductase [Salisediminibacterium selenitireducens]ADH98476.1 short-chain dehydrogenase/reductase SDR [[Bacillus] selenitireducens MLS10]
MTKRLDGKVAIITGGTGGIGKETALLFLKHGAKVSLVDINEGALDEVKKELGQFGDVITVKADVRNEAEVKHYVDETVKAFGTIDIFFNNAGTEGKVKPLTEQTEEEYDLVMDVNVKGVWLGMKHVLPVMMKEKSGSIINNSSVAGFIGAAGVLPYVTSKHAVIGATKTAALEAAEYNVRVNSIHPSPVDNRMMRSLEEGFAPGQGEAVKKAQEEGIPMHRYATNEEIANLTLFLASDESKFITGSQYRIDGGLSAK